MPAHKKGTSDSGKVRINIVYPERIEFYVATDDGDSVPKAFNLGCDSIETADGSEGLLISGYFSVVCAVLLDLVPLAERIMNVIGFRVCVLSNLSYFYDFPRLPISLRVQTVKFAQMCLLPFLKEKNGEVGAFWTHIATILVVEPDLLFGSKVMKRIYNILSFSALLPMLQKQTSVFLRKLMVTSSFGLVFSKVVEENRNPLVYHLVMVEKTSYIFHHLETTMYGFYYLAHKKEKSDPGKVRINIVHPERIEFYIATDDDSIQKAFNLGCNNIEKINCSEGLLISGYFSVVCAVLPDLVPLAEKIMNVLGFRVCVTSKFSYSGWPVSLRIQTVKFAQMCLLPFLKENIGEVGAFWTRIATVLHVEPNILFGSKDMKRIYNILSFSALLPMLQKQTTTFLRKLMVTSPFGQVFSKVVEENRKLLVYHLVMVEVGLVRYFSSFGDNSTWLICCLLLFSCFLLLLSVSL